MKEEIILEFDRNRHWFTEAGKPAKAGKGSIRLFR